MGINQDLYTIVKQELENIAPYVESHAGRIVLQSIDEAQGIVYLELSGTCSECPLSFYTVTMGIEARLKRKSSLISKVITENI